MYCEDLRPFSNVDGVMFKKFVSAVFKMGVQSKQCVDLNPLIPAANTATKYVKDSADKARVKMRVHCSEPTKTKIAAGFTMELWTDSVFDVNNNALHRRALQITLL